MPTDSESDLQFEIGHVLLIDVVGYSKLLVDEQIEFLEELNQIVGSTECFRAAETADNRHSSLSTVADGRSSSLRFPSQKSEEVLTPYKFS
jgi:hypothetical protein